MFRGIRIIPHDTKIDFLRFHKITFMISVLMVVGSILLIAFKGLNYGVDFAGGILMEVKTEGPADLAQLREQLSSLGLGEVSLQEFGAPDTVLLRLQRQGDEQGAQIAAIDKVKAALGPSFEFRRTEFVGPKVGAELIHDAVLATVLALFGIMAYVWFRYEWQFAVNCIVALFHDCITTVGLFALLGWQFDLNIVAAVLTIAGFSVNDTVVIYDRIREELRRYKKLPLGELLSMSINRTLSRTTMTSGLAFLSVLAIFLFGGEVLRGLSIALMWGIVVGTYSTIYVASPMLIYMGLRRDRVGGAPAGEANKSTA
ncbi:MAG: protein translocase subunit SecF [Pseudomonadota bacterium]